MCRIVANMSPISANDLVPRIRIYFGNELLDSSATGGMLVSYDNPVLEFLDCIAMTFEMEKNDTLHHKASGEMIMCPVRTAAELVPQIQSYPGTDGNIRRSLQYELDQEL